MLLRFIGRFIPVLCTVGFHQIFVWVEENSPVLIDASHPDGQHWSLQSGAEVHLLCFLLCVFPDEKTDVITTCDADLAISKLDRSQFTVVQDRSTSLVTSKLVASSLSADMMPL